MNLTLNNFKTEFTEKLANQEKDTTNRMNLLKQQMNDYLNVESIKSGGLRSDTAAPAGGTSGSFNDNVDLVELENMQKKLSKQENDINMLRQIGKNLEVLQQEIVQVRQENIVSYKMM